MSGQHGDKDASGRFHSGCVVCYIRPCVSQRTLRILNMFVCSLRWRQFERGMKVSCQETQQQRIWFSSDWSCAIFASLYEFNAWLLRHHVKNTTNREVQKRNVKSNVNFCSFVVKSTGKSNVQPNQRNAMLLGFNIQRREVWVCEPQP